MQLVIGDWMFCVNLEKHRMTGNKTRKPLVHKLGKQLGMHPVFTATQNQSKLVV